MHKGCILLIILLCPGTIIAAFLQLPPSATLAGTSSISLFDNSPASIFYNPALFDKSACFKISYSNPYSIPNLAQKNISFSYKIYKIKTALGLQQFGNKIYQENTAILSINHCLNEFLSLGISYRFLQKSVKTFSNKSTHQLDAGFKVDIKNITYAGSVINLNFCKLNKELLPQEFRNALMYHFSDNLKLGLGVVKQLNYPFSIKFATSYNPINLLKLSSGFQTEPHKLTAGVELKFFKATFSYAVRVNRVLPLSHYVSLQYPQ